LSTYLSAVILSHCHCFSSQNRYQRSAALNLYVLQTSVVQFSVLQGRTGGCCSGDVLHPLQMRIADAQAQAAFLHGILAGQSCISTPVLEVPD
jgi:hypothetical protein